MKKITGILFCIALMFFFSGNVIAQEKPVTKVTSVKQKGEDVRFSLTSSKPFIFGGNRYVLYIGNKYFTRNEQSHKNGKGYMTFLIAANDFSGLQEGADIYITYGKVNIEDEDMNELSGNSRKCWSLGKFSKNLLTK